MSISRERMLAEMGLGPVWRLRHRLAGAPAPVEPGVPEVAVDSPAPSRAAQADPDRPTTEVAIPDAEREARIARMGWDELRGAVAGCTACGLCGSRRNTVFGVGPESARWMIIGEAPGSEEDARGEPFVGQAGQLLDAMLASLGMTRQRDVYIANVLKCRPPGNRNPEAAEVARCAPHLLRQIDLVRPTLLLLMGRFAAHALLETDASIASMRGRVHRYRDTPAIVTYHPAYLLRTPADKSKAWEDLLFARATWTGLQTAAGAST